MKERLSGFLIALMVAAVPSMAMAQEEPSPSTESALSAPEAVPASAGKEIEGIYASVGLNADGKQYQQAVAIVANGKSLILVWVNGKGEVSARGIGFLEGDILSVAFTNGGEVLGLATYRLEDDTLVGAWDVFGSEGTRSPEVLVRVGPLAEEDREGLKGMFHPQLPPATPPTKGLSVVGTRVA